MTDAVAPLTQALKDNYEVGKAAKSALEKIKAKKSRKMIGDQLRITAS